MKRLRRVFHCGLSALLLFSFGLACGAETAEDLAARQKLAQLITAKPEDQPRLLSELVDAGSEIPREVLSAWTRDGVYLFPAPDGSKVPVLLEEQQDTKGKARAIQIVDGQYLKDAQAAELRFGSSELNTADTDSTLRKIIQQGEATIQDIATRVGTGFSIKQRLELQKKLDGISQPQMPFATKPKDPGLRDAHWAKPELVAEVEFTEWTEDGSIRHPSFQGLREDKKAKDVVREEPA